MGRKMRNAKLLKSTEAGILQSPHAAAAAHSSPRRSRRRTTHRVDRVMSWKSRRRRPRQQVEDLTAADFEVRVDGKPAPVTNFYLVQRGHDHRCPTWSGGLSARRNHGGANGSHAPRNLRTVGFVCDFKGDQDQAATCDRRDDLRALPLPLVLDRYVC